MDIAVFILLSLMAIHIFASTRRTIGLYSEFGVSPALGKLALLFPLGPVFLFLYSIIVQRQLIPGNAYAVLISLTLAFAAASLCYLPAMIVAGRQLDALERTGSDRDRVRDLISNAHQSFVTALAGVIYVGINLLTTVTATSLGIVY